MLQSHSSLLLQDFDKHLRALVSVLCELLKQPPMAHAACWALIGKVWPIVLSAQNSKGMQRLVTAAKKCPVKPTIAVCARLAEAAAWQLKLPVLEQLKDLVSEEASMAQVHVSHSGNNKSCYPEESDDDVQQQLLIGS